MKFKKAPKLKKGAWFYRTRGSYLPGTWQGWLTHLCLLAGGVALIFIAANDDRAWFIVGTCFTLELIGLGAVFSFVAARKS